MQIITYTLSKMNNLNETLYSIINDENLQELTKANVDKQLEFIILYIKLNQNLKEIADYCNNFIKDYYSKQNYSIEEINQIISTEEKINLKFIWNKEYNFSCRLITLSNQEEKFVLSKTVKDFFTELNNISNYYKGVKIIDFKCKSNRKDYIQIINTINLLSQLRFNNIKLK